MPVRLWRSLNSQQQMRKNDLVMNFTERHWTLKMKDIYQTPFTWKKGGLVRMMVSSCGHQPCIQIYVITSSWMVTFLLYVANWWKTTNRERLLLCCLFIIVVGYTGAKKGSCFKFLRVPSYLMQYDLLSILTPFLLKLAKKWDSAVQKPKLEEGGSVGVLKMAVWTKYLILHHTVYILVLSCIFLWSKIHLWKFWENRTIRIRKNGRLSPNWRRRALCV